VKFELNKPFESDQPTVEVDTGLPAGRHQFQLVVINDRGQRSQPTVATVIVEPPPQPSPI
jgi:hypothetical protein